MEVIRRHPYITAAFVGGTVFGAVAGIWLFEPMTWSVGRRLIAGALMGASSVLILTASRMLGTE